MSRTEADDRPGLRTEAIIRLVVPVLVLLLVVAACRRQPEPVAPQADPGPAARTALLGQTVALDATGSTAGPGVPLTYHWRLEQVPTGSNASLTGATDAKASLQPDVAGEYLLELTVTAAGRSDTAGVTITAVEQPVATAGGDQTVDLGGSVTLDSSGSRPAGESTRQWSLLAAPDGSALTGLQNATGVQARFTPDLNGPYTVQLQVSAFGFSSTDVAVIQVNGPPLAATGPSLTADLGATVALDGQASTDPDGDALAYSWTIGSAPAGSAAAIQEADRPLASFTPDLQGNYFLNLSVSDGRLTDSASLSLQVLPAGGLPLTTIHVAPDGDDTASGHDDAPLQTIRAALELADANPEVRRIQLAAGTYDQEPYDYDVDLDIQILGPTGAEPGATLVSNGTLFNVKAPARLVLLRLALESTETAIEVAGEAGLTMVQSTCRAANCITSGSLLEGNGSRVSVQDSHLSAYSHGSGIGIASWSGKGVQVTDSVVQGFSIGMFVTGGTFTVLDSEIRQNNTGVLLTGSTQGVMHESLLLNNQLGLQMTVTANARLEETTVDGATTYGVSLDAGAVLLMNGGGVLNATRGILLGSTDLSNSERASLRGVQVDTADHAVVVKGASSILDLGSGTQAGGNNLKSAAPTSYPLFDDREAGAVGLIQLSESTLNGWHLVPDTYTGVFEMSGRLRISAAGNSVTVHAAP